MNLNQITLPVTDFDRTVAFYQAMGFTLIVHSPPRYARFECPEGESTFSLHSVDTPSPSTESLCTLSVLTWMLGLTTFLPQGLSSPNSQRMSVGSGGRLALLIHLAT